MTGARIAIPRAAFGIPRTAHPILYTRALRAAYIAAVAQSIAAIAALGAGASLEDTASAADQLTRPWSGRTEAAAALLTQGTGQAVHDALGAFADASLDAQHRGHAGLGATATVVGPGETGIADLAGGLGAVDGGATAHLLSGEELANAHDSVRVAAARIVAAIPVPVAELAVGPTATKILATLEARAVTETGIGAAIGVALAGLAHEAAAHRPLAFDLGAVAVLTEIIAAIFILLAHFQRGTADAAGDAAILPVEECAGLGAAGVVPGAALTGVEAGGFALAFIYIAEIAAAVRIDSATVI